MDAASEQATGWWGESELQIDEARCWRVGPLRLWVLRGEQEWRLAYAWSEEIEEDKFPDWDVERDVTWPEDSAQVERHLMQGTSAALSLGPLLADRPVITAPRLPIFLPPAESATLYVGSPLWIEIRVGNPAVTLKQLPIRRPPDTWFGSSTREGELCYAARTRAALEVETLPLSTRRSLTPVEVHNRADTALRVERVKLPVPYLSVFSTPTGRLWTESVSMVREGETQMAGFEVHKGPPAQAKQPQLLRRARVEPEKGLLIRAFGTLFGALQEEES